ncbi:hypothetical protein HRG_011498 [Hirsutella rhossiliensis]|uniref:Uncharacterized protein n=1 Tax=Hirsutella rhossiliensis TaxID=111463 RepID=A0A9P8SDT6_9HYPO|nr:uncharacterized protein HRG_11498 [Hirsutella rhossiliensis]KAH0957351.1 hypothetical protein HRG_11498 [Hirsutella rhossiliensis]
MAAATAAALAADQDALHPSCLSATAQTRILVWRSEVASALDPPDSPHSSASSPSVPSASSSSSATVTTTAASSSLLPQPSRRRRFWRRIVRRLSARPDARPGALDPATGLAAGSDEVVRTAMYRLDDPFFDEVALGEPSSDGGRGALKDKQERLHRAARLLMHQNAMGVPATMAP